MRVQRAAFRVVFAYVVLFACESLLDSGPGPRALLAALRDPLVRWIGQTIFRLHAAPTRTGAQWALVQQFAELLVAIAIAAIWSMAARRTEYRRLNGWLRIV